ncbi:MAG: NAD-binding protein [Chloroflexi bacterium]|nr:NAD-binding protein [Chloroflexota bacterium]MCL5074738.1 NAD-binding protein [Chloroflexota bacterium]
MRIIILGCGRVGARLAAMLDSEGHDVTIIDMNSEAFRRLGPGFAGKAIVGIGIDEDVLKRAGIEHADAFVAVTNGDNTNIMASQMASLIFKVPKVVTRIYDPIREDTYHTLGLETVCPTTIGANAFREAILSSSQQQQGMNG